MSWNEEVSPWGDSLSPVDNILAGDTGASPWGQADPLDEEPIDHPDNDSDDSASLKTNDNPYGSSSAHLDTSQILGESTTGSGLNFVPSAPDTHKASPEKKKSPARSRARSSKIKRVNAEVQSVESGPLDLGSPVKKSGAKATLPAAKDPKEPLSDVSLENSMVRSFNKLSVDENVQTPGVEDAGSAASADEQEPELEGELKMEVGDPSQIGDITSTHTVYTITTTTDLPEFGTERLYSVTRRYRDFRWLYKALVTNNPGCVVPPPPEKQVFGRLNNDFVETRRAALDQMLKKIAKHPILRVDHDLVAFLTHNDFNEYLKTRIITDEELEAATGSGGFINSLGGVFLGKPEETDNWLMEKRTALDSLEVQLKGLARAMDLLHAQRKDLSDSLTEFAAVTNALADVEATRKLGEVLSEFAKVHSALSELYTRQKQQDSLFIESTVDEQLRLVNSIRDACNAKQRVQIATGIARQEAAKRKAALEKLQNQGRSQEDKIAAMQAEVEQYEKRAVNAENQLETVSKRVVAELSRVEKEKIADFRNAVELFLENAVEHQKQSIELWETFYFRYFSPPKENN